MRTAFHSSRGLLFCMLMVALLAAAEQNSNPAADKSQHRPLPAIGKVHCRRVHSSCISCSTSPSQLTAR